MNYYIGRLGRILKSKMLFDGDSGIGWYIYIHDDHKGKTEGYYVFYALPNMDIQKYKDFKQYKYDDWFLNKAELEINLEDFEIEWLDV